jgi:hypothetical protein
MPCVADEKYECPYDFYGGDTSMAAETTRDWFVNMVTYPPEFDGQLIFPKGGNTVEDFGEIPCFDANDYTAGACFKPPLAEVLFLSIPNSSRSYTAIQWTLFS